MVTEKFANGGAQTCLAGLGAPSRDRNLGSVTNARAKNDWSKIEHAVQQYEFVRIITPHHAKANKLGSWLWPRRHPPIRVHRQARRRIQVFACHPRAPGSERGA